MRTIVCVALGMAACAPATPEPSTGARPPEPGPAAATAAQPGITHHARIQGVVVGRDGQVLGGVQVVAHGLAEPATATAPRSRMTTGTDGRFSLPAQATFPASRGDSVQVGVKVVALGFIYATGGPLPSDSVVVPVTMVRATRAPNVYTTRLTLPVPPR